MDLYINDDTLFSLNFQNDQVIFAEDAECVIRKLNDNYSKWGFQMNYVKTKYAYVVIGRGGQDLHL